MEIGVEFLLRGLDIVKQLFWDIFTGPSDYKFQCKSQRSLQIISFSSMWGLINFNTRIYNLQYLVAMKVGFGYEILLWELPVKMGVGFFWERVSRAH